MGSSSTNTKFGHQQQQRDRLSIPAFFGNLGLPINTRMAEVKVILSILNFLGCGLYSYALFINLDNVKGTILMVIGSLFGIAKLYFYIVRSFQRVRRERQDEEMKHLEIMSKHREDKERELKQLEDELSLRLTGKRKQDRLDGYKNK